MADYLSQSDLHLLLSTEHFNPHSILGLHEGVIRLFVPGAHHLFFELHGQTVQAEKVDEAGLFQYEVPVDTKMTDYRIYHANGLLAHDPYAFWPTIGEVDAYLFGKGVHYDIYKVLGGRLMIHQNVMGAKFSVWAPNAKRVSVVGDFNHWDGRRHMMRSMGGSGIWEIFIPGLQEGEKYKFEIKTQDDRLLLKADPFAYGGEMRPKTASILEDVEHFNWQDEGWMTKRFHNRFDPQPMVVYEVHLGSWKKRYGEFLNYMELAEELVNYCTEMGFTHVELLPVSEHPLDESWGYQVTGFYAVTSRYGKPCEFQGFVNALHKAGIGVIVDWVPAHFPSDDFSLAAFDGTCLFEHADIRQGYHPHWNTLIFNYGRSEVSNFLIGNALFWCEIMHIDGLRVDAVASMLYLDYGRNEGEWIPNQYGGKENLEAIEFLKHLNATIHERHPGVLTIAEESTSFTGISHPVNAGGIGFSLKWNMGWMNDTLAYFSKDPLYRHYHQNMLTFGLIYAFTERFILVLSHDEVVHGKGSLMAKMPGDYWQQFANARLLYSYMMCQPGKKLLFMGGEIGQWNEWHCKKEIEWFLLDFPIHKGLQQCVKAINHLYRSHPALWEHDFDFTGFEWVDFSDHTNSVLIYRRKSSESELVCLHHFTPTHHPHYTVWLAGLLLVKEIFNSDEERFGGSGKVNTEIEIAYDDEGNRKGFHIQLAPLATQIYEIKYT